MRIELTNKGFADLCLTTWLPRPAFELSRRGFYWHHSASREFKSIPVITVPRTCLHVYGATLGANSVILPGEASEPYT